MGPTPPYLSGRHDKLSPRFELGFLGYDASVLPLNYESELFCSQGLPRLAIAAVLPRRSVERFRVYF